MASAEICRLYEVARAADDAWSDAIETVYGSKAGDARYDGRGQSTPELQRLYRAKYAADEAIHAAFEVARKAEKLISLLTVSRRIC